MNALGLVYDIINGLSQCKRLKLKCDRRIPCSSCQKRDCVSRCVYSQAAAEKMLVFHRPMFPIVVDVLLPASFSQ
jgi:positive regulator of sigma E activity